MSKVLLITGASTGIGAATAAQAVEAGWRVALTARSAAKLEALVAELGPERVAGFPSDVADFASQERLVAAVRGHFGRIDAVFANAGVGGQPGGFSAAPVASWRRMVDVNILGVAHTLRAVLADIVASEGHVLITGSVAGRKTLRGSMYSATKWAVSAIGYGLREELRGTGVRVTLIEPGLVDTPFFEQPQADALTASDVARSVVFALTQPASVDVHELVVLPTPPKDAAR